MCPFLDEYIQSFCQISMFKCTSTLTEVGIIDIATLLKLLHIKMSLFTLMK